MSLRHAAELEVRCPYPQAFDLACRVVSEKMTLKSADPNAGLIVASTSMGLATWGEDVEVRVWQSGPATSAIGVESALKFGLVDWGKNRRNVERVVSSISEAMGSGVLPAVAPAAVGAWHPDPSGAFELRWWDGANWGDQVSSGGVVSSSPLGR